MTVRCVFSVRCVFCRFPEDVAKLRSNTACCTGCSDHCVCLDRVTPRRSPRRPGKGKGDRHQ